MLIVGGLAALAVGAQAFVEGAIQVALAFGITEGIIGLTVVAIGTSLPELITSAVAALRKQTDIAVGNIVGSTICNILAILGFAGVLAGPLVGPGVAIANVGIKTAFLVVRAGPAGPAGPCLWGWGEAPWARCVKLRSPRTYQNAEAAR